MKRPSLFGAVNLVTDKLDLYDFRVRLASQILRSKARKCSSLEEYIALTSNIFHHKPLKYLGWSISTFQVESELQTLLSIVQKRKVHYMLEIGTAQGGTLFLFSKILCPDATIISLDLPYGSYGGGYKSFKIPFYLSFVEKNQHMHLLRGNSHLSQSLSEVESLLCGQKLDFLFIDGDHTYEGVKKDYLMYSPLVRKGGLIGLHDICVHPPRLRCEVSKFWNEIKTTHRHQEIIENPQQHWAGIGLLYN
jgi:predicted O-methyltransferase YrrM